MRIYTAGYTGQDDANLKRLAVEMDAIVVDIRLRPWSRAPKWRQHALALLLGNRYVHIPNWGNLNYNKPGPIQIRDLDRGMQVFTIVLQRAPAAIILLCACRDKTECHRGEIARYLAGQGLETTELIWAQQQQADAWKRRYRAKRACAEPRLFDDRLLAGAARKRKDNHEGG